MAHIVQCRVCKQKMDIDAMSKEEWTKPKNNMYYHKKCYDDWRNNSENVKADRDENFWYESLIDYLYFDKKMEINFVKLKNQWENFLKPNPNRRQYTPKGIYFGIRYYYDIMHGDVAKAQGGIGIIHSVYTDSANYWQNLEMRKAGTMAAIIEQIKNREARVVEKAIKPKRKQNKARFNLDDI